MVITAPKYDFLLSGNITTRLAINSADKSKVGKYAPIDKSNTEKAVAIPEIAITLDFFI